MTKPRKPATLPVKQLAILSICRFAEPVALLSVFPYLPEMIESFGTPMNQVPKWAGITSAVFSLSQAVTGIIWGRASDYFGRKPSILLGLTVTMSASLLFGFSRTLTSAIIARSIAGACSGTVGIIRTTVAEMVPQRELQPRAFSIMPLVWTIGSIVGPIFGGALAKPAEHYPEIFGNSAFLRKFPFALPNLVASVFFIVGLAAGILFLKETLETKKHGHDYGLILGGFLTSPCNGKRDSFKRRRDHEAASLLRASKAPSQILAPPGFREVFSPQSNLNLLAYSVLALHSIAFDQLVPVFLHLTPQDNRSSDPNVHFPFKFAGGFGLNSGRIGLIFTIYGASAMLVQFLVFPPLARRYGVLRCLRVCTLLYPIAYFLTPFTVLFPTPITREFAIFCVMTIKAVGGVFAFPCCTILLTNSARSLRLLGTLNGVSTSLSAIGRALGPAVAGGTFTLGVDIGYIIIPWWFLGVVGIIGHICTWWLIEMEGFGDQTDDASYGEEDSHEAQPWVTPNADGQAAALGTDTESSGPIVRPEVEPDEENDEEFAVEDEPLLGAQQRNGRPQDRDRYLTPGSIARKMSSPIGLREPVGPGGGRRLSNALGQSNSGLGTGGGSFH